MRRDNESPLPLDDEDEEPKARRKKKRYEYEEQETSKKPSLVLWLGVGWGATVVLGLIAFGALSIFLNRALKEAKEAKEAIETREAEKSKPQLEKTEMPKPPVFNPGKAEPGTKCYTRDEFRKLVVGKTQDEVLSLLGKPTRTTDGPFTCWNYSKITIDPISEKV